jgi:hypothetical protein
MRFRRRHAKWLKIRHLPFDLSKDRGGHVTVFETFVPTNTGVSVMVDDWCGVPFPKWARALPEVIVGRDW